MILTIGDFQVPEKENFDATSGRMLAFRTIFSPGFYNLYGWYWKKLDVEKEIGFCRFLHELGGVYYNT